MTEYNTLNVKLTNSQLAKLRFGLKNAAEATLKMSSNIVGNSNDENNFPHKLLLTKTQVLRLHKAFLNNSSANIKSLKTLLYKLGQSGGFLGKLLGQLLKTGFSLVKNVLKPQAKSQNFNTIRINTAVASVPDAAIHKKMFGSGVTTLIISNDKMNDIMKMVKSLEESGLLVKVVSEIIKNEAKEHKGAFSGMLLSTLGASLLGKLLTGKDTIRAGEGAKAASQGQDRISLIL